MTFVEKVRKLARMFETSFLKGDLTPEESNLYETIELWMNRKTEGEPEEEVWDASQFKTYKMDSAFADKAPADNGFSFLNKPAATYKPAEQPLTLEQQNTLRSYNTQNQLLSSLKQWTQLNPTGDYAAYIDYCFSIGLQPVDEDMFKCRAELINI